MDCPIIRLSECTTAVVTLATGVAEQADAQRQEKGTESDHKESDQQGSAVTRPKKFTDFTFFFFIWAP